MSKTLPRTVLAVGAHPDDIELLCAGTLARFVAVGATVHLGVACNGNRGGLGTDLTATRRKEASRAAEILGASITFLDLGDADVWDTPENRLRFIRLIQSTRPELILSHGPTDYHDDHVRVGELVAKCSWFATSPSFQTGVPALNATPALFHLDNIAGINFEPTHLVDITETMDVKRRMLACHASQLERRESGFPALDELAETHARFRGFQCGVPFAEGFRPALLWGRRRAEPIFP